MRNFMVILAIALCGALVLPKQSVAQDATIQKVWGDDGSSDKRINVVYFMEGFTRSELPRKVAFLKTVIDSSLKVHPINILKGVLRIHIVSSVSLDSGISDSTKGISKNTFLGMWIKYASPYDISADGRKKLAETRKKLLPEYDLDKDRTVIMINDTTGLTSASTGSDFSTIDLDERWLRSEVLVVEHEVWGIGLGHNDDEDTRPFMANLKYGGPLPYRAPNLSMETDLNKTPWGPFVNTKEIPTNPDDPKNWGNVVGWFKGGDGLGPNAGLGHSQAFCLMDLTKQQATKFCVACMQSIYLQISKRVGIVENFFPNSPATMPDSGIVFGITPNRATVSVQWFLNGELFAAGPTCTILPDSLASGTYTLVASMKDTTDIVRKGYELYGNDPTGFHYEPDGKSIPYVIKIDPDIILKGSLVWQIAISEQVAGKGTNPYAAADFNGDGVVNFEDFFLFAAAFSKRTGDSGFDPKYDLSKDGIIDFRDFFLFVDAFGKKVSLKKTR